MTVPVPAPAAFWLVRHAATSWTGVRWCGRADPPLTAEGEAAATDLAARLASEVPAGALVVASSAVRARCTAEAIATVLEAPVTVLASLLEVDVGRAEGLTWDELRTREPETAAAIVSGAPFDWPGGESRAEVAARAAVAAQQVRSLAGGRPAVVVSHGGILRAIAPLLGCRQEPAAFEPCGVVRIGGVA